MNKHINKTVLAIAIGSILSTSAHAAITDIIISEYVEGSANNKAIELTNTGSDDYTFTDAIELQYSSYTNQVQNASAENVLAGQTIAAGSTLVIYNGAAEDELVNSIVGDKVATGTWDEVGYSSLNYNGDEHVAIVDVDDDTTYDTIGIDGTYWGSDVTVRRRLEEGNATPTQSSTYNASDWEEFDTDSFEDLGTSTYSEYQESAAETSVCVLDTQTTIAEAQGSGTASPLIESYYETDEAYDITGIVTMVTSKPVAGFYMQDVSPDGDETTSDGIFVKTSNATDDMIGNTICVNSTVSEYYTLTQLETDEWDIVDDTSSVPAATDIEMIADDNGSFNATLERYEGMLVNLPDDIDPNSDDEQTMRVTKAFGFNYDSYRNDMILAYETPNMNPTQDNIAGSDEATATELENDDHRLIIESSESADDGDIPYYPNFNLYPEDNYVRINDSVVGMEGVISYGYSNFNLVVTNELNSSNFVHNDDRTSSPDLDTSTEDDHFVIKVGTQNLLNLFNSPFGGDSNSYGENRGADSDEEYEKQLAKLVSAITGLNADIVGLMEIENNGFGTDSAIQALVDAINEEYYDEDPDDVDSDYSTSNQYVFVGYDANGDLVLDSEDSLGSDAISTGLLYRPSKVSIESMAVIAMPEQHADPVVNANNAVMKDGDGATLESGDNYQRDTLTATFKVNNTGKTLTVAVNHFKSKGSTCAEDWDGVDFIDDDGAVTDIWSDDAPDADSQGSCENLRVSAAVQLAEELDDMSDDIVIVGDLNSYGQEDPLLVLTENTTGKKITSARDSYIDDKPQFNLSGSAETITESYGYISAVNLKDEERGESSWSYSYDDEIGSLDHILISPSLETRLLDAVDWHINSAESSLYDYNEEYKGDDVENFYVDDAYRSSDHDSAIMALSYQYGETDSGESVHLTISSSAVTVPYVLPEGAIAGDAIEISLSSSSDMSELIVPNNMEITEDNQLLAEIELYGIEEGTYTATMILTRDGEVQSEFTETMKFTAASKDSTTASVAPAEEYDGSGGGSFGLFSLLSLLGLGFLRRTQKAK
ncbi:ExeM/NucH family extracellular endonuclease [Psychromonas sp. PT13]|uniref:ExeM/NucH family extracellular endonuclease n=1 Tax=Psychromonas sp. PT13 TaxID=3439547 RepID=UPI003EBBDB29